MLVATLFNTFCLNAALTSLSSRKTVSLNDSVADFLSGS
jgi:hypothetical protein